ncbi:MAG: type II CRISPR-associated endonuclease Cas1, partial [Alloprevotella sp.]
MIKRTLYFGNPAYLSLSSRQLVIRKSESQKEGAQGENICTRAIEDIGVIVIDHSQITLTSALIAALLDNNVALITCDSHHMPTGLLLPLSGNTIQSERFQAQVSASLPLKKQLWQQTVKQKIANQSTILRQFTSAETGCMDKWSNDVRSGAVDNLEGRAAAYYWKNLF